MKEIADHTQMAASVLSSLYSSVLPTFIGEVKKGIAEEEALDYALSQVNNVSKKRLLGNLEDMKERLFELEPPQGGEKRKSPFWDMMARESQVSAQEAYNYSGIYISYSLSSAADALKVEPTSSRLPKQRIRTGGAHECLQHHPFRRGAFQQSHEFLHPVQRA